MRNEALYQKYRSRNFDEVVGQEYVVRSIRNAVREGKVGHAYLFCGPRGTGKTTMARLLARAVNCGHPEKAPCGECDNCRAAEDGNHPDIIEINAANETHVEDIRDLIERARLSPMKGRHKIYIIDEVHQLSSSAASALLKTLEEPPEHIIFILATTDPQKLLNTIIARCQRFDFSKVSTVQIKDHLLHIAEAEGMQMEPAAAEKIARLADGGMRDALSMLEQAASYANRDIHEKDIDAIYGLASTGEKIELLHAIFDGDFATLLQRIEGYEASGLDLKRLTTDLIDALKDSIIYSYTTNESLLRTLNKEQANQIIAKTNTPAMLTMIDQLMKAAEDYKTAQSIGSVFEVACMKMIMADRIPAGAAAIPVPIPASEKTNSERSAVPEKPYHPEDAVPLTLDLSGNENVSVPTETPAKKAEEPPVIIETAPKEKTQTELVDADMVVRLLVQCNKDTKAADTDKLVKLMSDFRMDRFIAALKQTELKASGNDCLVLTTISQAVADNLNEADMNRSLHTYLAENAGIDKIAFVITENMYKDAVQKFVELRKTGALPEPLVIRKYKESEEKKGESPQSPEDKLRSLLGDDALLKVYE